MESRIANLESILFTIDNSAARQDDKEAEWLIALYLTTWMTKRLQTTFKVAFELVAAKIPGL